MALRLTTPAAIVLGSAIVAAGIVGARLVPRYEVREIGGASTFWRLNVTTGAVELCAFQKDAADISGRMAFRCRADW